MAAEHHEFHLAKNTVLILVVVQLTALLFGLMMVSHGFNSIACSSGFTINGTSTPGSGSLCSFDSQVQGINSTIHSLTGVLACASTPTLSQCTLGWNSGDLIPEFLYQVANAILGFFEFIVYLVALVVMMLILIIFILTIFFPGLFASAGVGSGLGNLGAALGGLFGILFAGATLIMAFYLLQLVKDMLPWFGKH
jgi:hypothetical protein